MHFPAVVGLFTLWLQPPKGILVSHGCWLMLAVVAPLPGTAPVMYVPWQWSLGCWVWSVGWAAVLLQRMGCAVAVLQWGVITPCITVAPCSCQSAGDQLSQELERAKKELEQVKGELGM